MKNKTMKNTLITISLSIFCTFVLKINAQGTYTIDGKTYSGKVSTQEFVNKNFSVLCEYSDETSSDYKKWKYDLLQITFHSEAEARKGGTFVVSSTSKINQESGTVSLGGHEGFASLFGDGKGTITVTNKTIKISNIKATQYPATHQGDNKSCIINSAIITFE
jgi:hypothetical protein